VMLLMALPRVAPWVIAVHPRWDKINYNGDLGLEPGKCPSIFQGCGRILGGIVDAKSALNAVQDTCQIPCLTAT